MAVPKVKQIKQALQLLQDTFDSLQDGESFNSVKGDFFAIAKLLGGEIDDEYVEDSDVES
jgi:hypothetical protein